MRDRNRELSCSQYTDFILFKIFCMTVWTFIRPEYLVLDMGYLVLDMGYLVLDMGYLVLDMGYLVLDMGLCSAFSALMLLFFLLLFY